MRYGSSDFDVFADCRFRRASLVAITEAIATSSSVHLARIGSRGAATVSGSVGDTLGAGEYTVATDTTRRGKLAS